MIEIKQVTPRLTNEPRPEAHAPSVLGVKWQLNEETEAIPTVGIFPLVETPTGNADKGLGNGYSQVFLPVWLQKKWGNLQTYGGGGYWINNGPD